MKLIITKENLIKALQKIIGVVEKRQTMPILSHVFFRASGESHEVIASDLEVQLSSKVELEEGSDFSENITIPDNTDIIYIGISKFGIKSNKSSKQIYCENINDNIVKIYNMLSLHGIIICSIRGLISLQKCFLESYYTDKIWDNYTAKIQPILNVYALKQPLIYQDKSVGGIENDTKFSIKSINNKTLDMENTLTTTMRFMSDRTF